MNELGRALLLSVGIALLASLLVLLVTVPLGYTLSRRRFRGKSVLEALLLLPLVLPPTVVGYYLILLLGRRGYVGQYLYDWFDYSVMFHWHGGVVAGATVAFPLMYLSARSAFAGVTREMEDMARTMGAGGLRLFWYVSLPMAWKGLAAGWVLSFSRALGEFGATLMVMGDLPQYQSLPLLIYTQHMSGQPGNTAGAAVALLTMTALSVVVLYNRSAAARQD